MLTCDLSNKIFHVQARFQGDGGHVVNSVLQIIRMYTIEGNKSKNEAYHEVGFLVRHFVCFTFLVLWFDLLFVIFCRSLHFFRVM